MHQLLQTKTARITLLIGAVFLLFIVSEKVSLAMDLHALAIVPNSQPTGKPAAKAASVRCGQGGTTGNGSTGAGLRYFAVGTAVSVMQAGASALRKQRAQALVAKAMEHRRG